MKSIYAVLLSAAFLLSLSPALAQDGEAPTNQDLLERIEGVERLLDEQEEVIQEQVTINNDQKILIDKLKDSLLPNIQPVGSLIFMALEKPPAGYLYCDGSVRGRTEFAELFDAIGETWGKGDGSTTFNLPDLRGEFIRVWSKGHSVDSGRRVGQAQGQSTSLPSRQFVAADAGGHGHSVGGNGGHNHSTGNAGNHGHSMSTTGSHGHSMSVYKNENLNSGSYQRDIRLITSRKADANDSYASNSAGNHSHSVNATGNHNHSVSSVGNHGHSLGAAPNHPHNITGGDAETRPRNQALACYIKAFSHSAF